MTQTLTSPLASREAKLSSPILIMSSSPNPAVSLGQGPVVHPKSVTIHSDPRDGSDGPDKRHILCADTFSHLRRIIKTPSRASCQQLVQKDPTSLPVSILRVRAHHHTGIHYVRLHTSPLDNLSSLLLPLCPSSFRLMTHLSKRFIQILPLPILFHVSLSL